jgi:hypothetical protein
VRENIELDRFKEILLELATREPDLPVGKAFYLAVEIEETLDRDMPAYPNDFTPVEIAAKWCRRQPAIVDLVVEGKKINAIKEARALSYDGADAGMGLHAAKEAVEYMEAHLLP